jgi:hypothetical protein
MRPARDRPVNRFLRKPRNNGLMAIFYFDVHSGDVAEPDELGTELSGVDGIPVLAIGLALTVAREKLPLIADVIVSVRDGAARKVFRAALRLESGWHAET